MATSAYLSPKLQKITGGMLRPGGLFLTDRALDLCRFPPQSRLLDLGCGLGATMRHMRAAHDHNIVGLDLSFQMLSKAGADFPEGIFIQAAADAVPLSAECMEGIFGECVMSLMPDPACVLAECCRILRPKGKLVLTDLYVRHPQMKNQFSNSTSVSCLTGARGQSELSQMIIDAGFEIVHWEDHTDLLTQLAVNMIFSEGSMDWFWDLIGGGGHNRQDICRSKPGYFLMIACKREISNG